MSYTAQAKPGKPHFMASDQSVLGSHYTKTARLQGHMNIADILFLQEKYHYNKYIGL